MKKILFILLFGLGIGSSYSQSLIQTYVDRCTGEVKVFSIPLNGPTTVVFYNKSKTFTAADVQSGVFRAWLEETYLWWSTLNPCSTATTNVVTTQAQTQATTEAATQAATSAAAAATQTPAVPASPPPTNDTSTQNTTTNTSASSTANSTDSTQSTDSGSTTGSEGGTTNDSGGTTEGGSETGGETQTESKTEETKTEETKTEETKSEESKEEVKEESKEETKEEKKEEKEKKKEEKKKEKKEKKKDLPPPIVTANVAMMQAPDGTYSYASTFGVSRSSLMGDKTYGVNTMIWSNLQQFMVNVNYTQVHINKEGRASRVYSASIGGAKMFTTVMGMVNHSVVFLGKKGSAAGVALGTNITSIEFNVRNKQVYFDKLLASGAITGFYTKPIPTTDKLTLSPMLAISSPFISYNLFEQTTTWNKDLMFIGGLSGTFNLTKRFGLNIGINAVTGTIKDFPVLINYTIGSRFSF